jgi:hypothetical protein
MSEAQLVEFARWTLAGMLRDFKEGIANPEDVLAAIEALIDAKRLADSASDVPV